MAFLFAKDKQEGRLLGRPVPDGGSQQRGDHPTGWEGELASFKLEDDSERNKRVVITIYKNE